MSLFQGRFIQRIVILTGAGVSAESGLNTFRDSGGLWENHDPMEIATPEAFERDPGLVYRFYNARWEQLADVAPNPAHEAIARLQDQFRGQVFLVTQNVDDLHERGGSQQVCHMHGELASMWCRACDGRFTVTAAYNASSVCPGCGTDGKLRPDIVWFGEIPYDMERIAMELSACELFIAIGTSGTVYPAAGFVQQATRSGATAVEVNKAVSDVTGFFHDQRQGPATIEVPALVDELLSSQA